MSAFNPIFTITNRMTAKEKLLATCCKRGTSLFRTLKVSAPM
jgi:hypothetical protein